MRPNKTFLYFLVDPLNTGNFYVDTNGVISSTNIPTPLRYSPQGWLEAKLTFARNAHYFGLNRSFSLPLTFYGDGAAIIRELFWTKRGIEQAIQLVVMKWNPLTDVHELYYKGFLDLANMLDTVAQGVEVNIMEGGVAQMLKTLERTVFEIPCDGSIKENLKVYNDGILYDDVFHYQIPRFDTAPGFGTGILPATFINNDGDNIGITKGDPSYEQDVSGGHVVDYYRSSVNYIFSSTSATTVRISGYILVKAGGGSPSRGSWAFHMQTVTSFTQLIGSTGYLDHTQYLVPNNLPPNYVPSSGSGDVQLLPNTTYKLPFSADVSLAANENLFINLFWESGSNPATIIGGQFSMTFKSRYQPTTIWGVTAYDLWQLIMQQANALSSNSLQQYSYLAHSSFLAEKRNVVFTSGDAIRASGDPDYLKYFNTQQVNPLNSSYQFFNYFFAYGPVIKISISDFFDSLNPVYNLALGNERFAGEQEAIFIEQKEYVFDSSLITMEIGEIANLRLKIATDYYYTNLDIGWPSQSYDQKSGKFEYNTTAKFQSPNKAIPNKTLTLVSSSRADSYGIETLRVNTGGNGTAQNNSDASPFMINVDTTAQGYDSDSATFTAVPLGALGVAIGNNNGDAPLVRNVFEQGVSLPTIRGTYLRPYVNTSIYVSRGTLSILPVTFTYSGTVSGLPGDSVTLTLYINGSPQGSKTYAVTSAVTAYSDSISTTDLFSEGDVVYCMASTTATATSDVNTAVLDIGTGMYTASSAGDNNIQAGTPGQLIEMPLISGTTTTIDSVQYYNFASGLPALIFNEYLLQRNFTGHMEMTGFIQGAGQTLTVKLFINGQIRHTEIITGSSGQSAFSIAFDIPARDYAFGDILFITASASATCVAEIATGALTLQSTQILLFPVLRKTYDSITGVPNPETAYNIEEFTPHRMVEQNSSLIMAPIFNLQPDELTFLSLDKNQYLRTQLGDDVEQENANISVSPMGILYYAIEAQFTTKVPMSFEQLKDAANGHIHATYGSGAWDLYFFPTEVTQQDVLNNAQEWKCLISPKTDLTIFRDLNITGLENL